MDRFPRRAFRIRTRQPLAVSPGRPARRSLVQAAHLLLLAALFLPDPARAQQPDSAATPVILTGVVYDVLTGTAIPTAQVSLQHSRQGVLTDSDGVFRLGDVDTGPQLLVVTQFGYQQRVLAMTLTPEWEGMIEVAMTPRPIMLEGVTATVENITEMEARLRFRRRANAASSWAYDQQELFRSMSGTPLDFLNRRTLVRVVTCPPGVMSSRCVYRRGRAVEPWVYVDEMIAWGGLDELESYPVSDIYLMEVYAWGSEIRVYTNRFMERMARKPVMLIPLNLWPRPSR